MSSASKITKIAIAQLIGRFRRRSAPFCKAGSVLDVMRTTLGHGFDFPMSIKIYTGFIQYFQTNLKSIGWMVGMVGTVAAGRVVCMVVFVADTRIALQVDARVVWMTCRASLAFHHPWLASESSGEQSCAISRVF